MTEAALVESLALRQLTAGLSVDEWSRLEQLVLDNEQLLLVYVDHVRDTAQLRMMSNPQSSIAEVWGTAAAATAAPVLPGEMPARAAADQPSEATPGRVAEAWQTVWAFVNDYMALSIIISGLFITTLLLSMALLTVPRWQPGPASAPDNSLIVATITTTRAATWNESSAGNFKNRDLFAGELLILDSGLAELEFEDGAQVVLEGPCEFTVVSSGSGRLDLGRLRAVVPVRASGFTIETTALRLVDLGTEFGVLAHDDGAVDVLVFEGLVDCIPPGESQAGERVRLGAGQGASASADGKRVVVQDQVDPAIAKNWKRGTTIDQGEARAKSKALLDKLRKDPALIALFDFEGEKLPEGIYQTSHGRWSGNKAAEFLQAEHHIPVDIGGQQAFKQVTLAAWVRVDQFSEALQSLMHTNGWGPGTAGSMHWMINEKHTMRLAVIDQMHPDSQTSLQPHQGRWLHLAVVYDAEKRTARFYVNGELDNEVQLAEAAPIRLGPAQIGNWSDEQRILGGRIDELVVLGRAMSDDEVRAMSEAGEP